MTNIFFNDVLPDDLLENYPNVKKDTKLPQGADAHRRVNTSLGRRIKTSLYITEALHLRLKVYCASNSRTMADVLDECISAYLQRKERLADKHNSSNTD